MAVKIIDQNYNKALFNKLALHPLQSWEWGEARKKMGIKVLRIGNETDVYQITFHKVPYTKYKIGYLPRSNFPSKEVINFLTNYCKKNNVIFIKLEPYIFKNTVNNETVKQWNNVSHSPHPLFPNWTLQIDLTKSEELLLKQMKPKTRYNINLAEKKGVIVKEESNEKGFAIFQKLYFATCKRQKYHGHNHYYHKLIWQNLKEKIAHILIAYYQNIPLVAYEIFIFNNTLYYPYGGSSLMHRNVMAANLLMWETIRFGKKLGVKKFDMWGSLPMNHDSNHPWAGFTRFKEGYGGKFVEFIGSYDLIISSLLYQIYKLAWKFRNIYLIFTS